MAQPDRINEIAQGIREKAEFHERNARLELQRVVELEQRASVHRIAAASCKENARLHHLAYRVVMEGKYDVQS